MRLLSRGGARVLPLAQRGRSAPPRAAVRLLTYSPPRAPAGAQSTDRHPAPPIGARLAPLSPNSS